MALVRAEIPNPQDMEQSEMFPAAVITLRRSHEGNFFLPEAAAVCSFPFWSQYFCTSRLRATGLAQDMIAGVHVG